MPFLDSITWIIVSDQTAVETAYRTGQLDETSLTSVAIDGIAADFPDHLRFERSVVVPLAMRFNYNEQWDENPWLDRRVPYAFHMAMDRDNIIDFVYLGKGKPSAIQNLNWYHGWSIPDDEMRLLPGYQARQRGEDITDGPSAMIRSGGTRWTAHGVPAGRRGHLRRPSTPVRPSSTSNMFRERAGDRSRQIETEPYN